MKDNLFGENYTEETFKAYVNNIFILLFSSVMNKDLKRIDHFVSDDVYKQFENMVNDLQDNIHMYEQLNVKTTEIMNITEFDDKYVAVVKIISRALDYIMNVDGKIISGNDKTRVERENILTLEIMKDVKTQKIVRKCLGCGANMDVNYSGVCEYCGRVYNNQDYNWILTNIETK